jgi:predicted amidohydrolase
METIEIIKAAAVQFTHRPGDIPYNMGRVEHFCRLAAAENVRLIAFPEMCLTGYWHVRHLSREEIKALAEPVPDGPSSRRLSQLAREHGLLIGAGLIEKTGDGRLFNTYIVCDTDGSIHAHRKIHCFISEHMDSGDAYTVFDTSLGRKIGVLTCYDNNINENVRITALMGADILLAPHQTGGCRSRTPHALGAIDPQLWHDRDRRPEAIEAEIRGPKGRDWLMRWLPARAHDNGLFLVFSNGVGPDDDEIRTGNAMILDPYGRILAETWKAGDDIVIADLDMSLLEQSTGRGWRRARKPHLYDPLTQPTGQEVDPRTAKFSE